MQLTTHAGGVSAADATAMTRAKTVEKIVDFIAIVILSKGVWEGRA